MNTPYPNPGVTAQRAYDDAYTLFPDLRHSLQAHQHQDLSYPGQFLTHLQEKQLANPPLPAQGSSLERWKILAEVARVDLSLVKLYEGHTDAIAIVHELLQLAIPGHSTWGVWCAESPDAQVISTDANCLQQNELMQAGFNQPVTLHGTKAWCSGASQLSHALVSTANQHGERQLVAVALHHNHVTMDDSSWVAVGMRHTGTSDVQFDGSIGYKVGGINDYINRPGFWHGGAGIAACWFGAASRLAEIAIEHCRKSPAINLHTAAHLGAIDVAMSGAAAVLRDTAAYLDEHPDDDAQAICMRIRLVVESAVERVLEHAGKALGAAAFCKNEVFARMHADLTVFIRQSHAEKDLEALGKLQQENPSWKL